MIDDTLLRQRLEQGIQAQGIVINSRQVDQLLQYLKLLAKWNLAYNLTAVRNVEEMIPRHLLDSLSVAPFIQGERFIDVGTGPGLPGIPLAILFPERHFLLVDSNGKKTRFLTQCKLEMTLPNVEVQQGRIEQVRPEWVADGILSRAFASIADFVHWTRHLVGPETRLYAMKGQYPREELAQLPEDYRVEAEQPLSVPDCDGERHLLIIAKA